MFHFQESSSAEEYGKFSEIDVHFFKERLGLKLTHKRITTKVVLPVSKGKGAILIQGEVQMCKKGEVTMLSY